MNNPYLQEYQAWIKEHTFYPSKNDTSYLHRFSYEKCSKDGSIWNLPCYEYNIREQLTKKYSWAIPTEEAITTLLKYSPIIEVGAGTGYWASLVKQAGGDIVVSDIAPPISRKNIYHLGVKHQFWPINEYLIATGDEAAAAFSERTLFTCWPPFEGGYAGNMLRAYSGNTVIYVGEGQNGCTGDDDFHFQLAEEWNWIGSVYLPSWPSVHDYMMVYHRKEK